MLGVEHAQNSAALQPLQAVGGQGRSIGGEMVREVQAILGAVVGSTEGVDEETGGGQAADGGEDRMGAGDGFDVVSNAVAAQEFNTELVELHSTECQNKGFINAHKVRPSPADTDRSGAARIGTWDRGTTRGLAPETAPDTALAQPQRCLQVSSQDARPPRT